MLPDDPGLVPPALDPALPGWLDSVWTRTVAVRIVAGGEDAGPLSGRAVVAELRAPADVTVLRALSTAGTFTGDICRCHGGPTVVLLDAGGAVLGGASVHGYGTLSWERSRFGSDLEVTDPAGLHLFLAGHGDPGQLTCFLAPLMDVLDLHERDGEPQFRPAGAAGRPLLAARGVPAALHAPLSAVSGFQAAELPDEQFDDLHRRLAAAVPDPSARAVVLLGWLGSLPVPMEAVYFEGVLVRRLLADLSTADLAAAAVAAPTGPVAMGVVNWAMMHGADATLAAAVAPALRRLLPAPATHTRTR